MELRKEVSQVLYEGEVPLFMIKQNGELKWYRMIPATQEDMEHVFNAKKADL